MKKLFLILALVCSICVMNAQNTTINLPRALKSGSQTSTPEKNRPSFFVGGNINSNFGYNFALMLEGGIYAKDWLRIGIGPRYELSYRGNDELSHAFGASAFIEGIIANYILLHVGYEYLNYPTMKCDENGYPVEDEYGDYIKIRNGIHALALGVGFNTRVSENVNLYALYSLYPICTKNDYYSRIPMFARIGVTVKL
ncbi:MAG: hypothetical protein MJZ57_02690 [Bacteroidales bacterium]|nr:hypothetical protein [Bacteroidales bacterium]